MSSMRTIKVMLLVLLVVCFAATVEAQTTLQSVGSPQNSALFPVEHGFINLGNGELHLEIPLAGIPQRGDLAVPATLVYDSSIWEVTNGLYGLQWSPTGVGKWSFQYDRNYAANAAVNSDSCPGDPSRTIYIYTAVQWRDTHNTSHTFPVKTIDTDGCATSSYTDTPAAAAFATDASGYYGSVANYTDLNVWDSKGTLIAKTPIISAGISNAKDVDRNGNYIEYGVNGAILHDSMYHTPITETIHSTDSYGYPAVIYLDVLAAQNQSIRYVLNYGYVSTATAFNVPASNFVPGLSGNVAEWSANVRVLTSIDLPDGTHYTFGYDNYALLNSVRLPHGGTVSYGYTSTAASGTTLPARWISSHSGSDGSTTFTLANTGSYSPTSETGGYTCDKLTNTATGSKLIQTYVFSSCGGAVQPMKLLLSPVSSPSTVDKLSLYSYDFSTPCQNGACTGAQWIVMTGITNVIPSSGTTSGILGGSGGTGLIADTQIVREPTGSGKIISVKQWDYRSGTYPAALPDTPPGNPSRETDTTLGYTVNHAFYPTAVVTKDSSTATVAEIHYAYDEPSYFVASPGGVPNHDNLLAAANRGNVTTITRVPHGTGAVSNLVQHIAYDDAGAVISVSDAKGNTTLIGRDATDTFPQTITRPSTSGLSAPVAHVSSVTRDFNTGQVLSTTDENGQTTTYQFDTVGRLSTVQFSNGGTPVTLQSLSYPTALETDITSLQVQDAYMTASIPRTIIVDGFGRVVQKTQSDVSQEFTYDTEGRLQSVTNPHTSTSEATDGTTSYMYDELGRISTITPPNGHSSSVAYSANTSTVTDSLGHQRKGVFDAFGHLKEVWEPDASGNLSWQTVYTRNDLGLLTQIDQKGGSTSPSDWRTRTFTFDGLGRLASQTSKEAGQYSYSYDPNGNLVTFSNANSTANTVTQTYDALNRVLTRQIGGGPTYTYTYDAQDASGDAYGIGRLTSTSDGSSIQSRFHHDPMGRITSEASCRPSSCAFGYVTSASYDFDGNLRSVTYPDGREIWWTYDLFDRPTDSINTSFGSTPLGVPLLGWGTYFPTGQLRDIYDGSGVELTTSFNSMGNLTSLSYNNGTPLVDRTFSWDTNGKNLLGVSDAATGRSQTFTYDQLDRLQTATDTGTTGSATNPSLPSVPPSSMSYTYDAWGNLKQAGNWSFVQNFDANNQISASGYTYDAAGNLTHDGLGNSYTYRADGHQTSSNGVNYAYDASGQRVAKSGSAAMEYFYFGGKLLATRDPSSGAWTDMLYGANGLMGTVAGSASAVPAYRIGDHLSTLSLTTDDSGNVTGGLTTLPFGQVMSNTTTDNQLFTEHEWDAENSTSNTAYRQYSPVQGRWLSPDPYSGSYNLADPQSLNRYSYVQNSPLNALDPLGLDFCVVSGASADCSISVSFSGAGGSSYGGGSYNGPFSGWGYTFSGGGAIVTPTSASASVDPSFYARQAYQYNGPSSTSSLDHNRILDWTQTAFRFGGMIPEVGAVFNAINVGIDLYRGNYGMAALDGVATALSIVPGGAVASNSLAFARTAEIAEETVTASRTLAATSNELGAVGEASVRAAYDIGEKQAIEIAGRTRIPDGLTDTVLSEVKNVSNLSFTQQLRDYASFAQETGRRFDLYVREGARLSGPLTNAIDNGIINLVFIP